VDNAYGIEIDDSLNNEVAHCNFSINFYGLLLDSSPYNDINYCHFNENLEGIYCYSSNNNDIYYNDFLFNQEQVYDDSSNHWDDGSKGNYWSNYYGVEDKDDDGIYNSPYYIPGSGNKDKYPLANEFECPVALFTSSQSMVKVNEIVTFDASESWNLDGNIVKYYWKFYDGDSWHDMGPTLTYRYNNEGNYTVTLKVHDDKGLIDNHSSKVKVDGTPPTIEWKTPKEGYLYIFNRKIMPIGQTIIIGNLTIYVDVHDTISGVNMVKFYIDGNLKNTDTSPPYKWLWDEMVFFDHMIRIEAYDNVGNVVIEEMEVLIFNL
jgi:parallel beta-helix repeat protein